MTIEPYQYLIVCPLICLGGFVDAIAGGGGLITLPAYMIAGFPTHQAIATNKLSASMGAVTATWRYAKQGFIPYKQSIFYVLCGLGGSAIGARIALMIDDYVFKIIMLVVIPLTALYLLRTKVLDDKNDPLPIVKTVLIGMAVAFFLGIYDGFYGPGTGTFLILLLVKLAHINLQESNGIAKAINLSTNIGSLAVFLTSGKVVVMLGLVAGLCSIAGNYLGTVMFVKGGSKITRPIMLIVLAVFFVRIVSELL